jgi:hypothetical protein
MLAISSALFLPEIKTLIGSSNPPILDLGQYAKLKGLVEDTTLSLTPLAGISLKRYANFSSIQAITWTSAPTDSQLELLAGQVDCVWQIYMSLHSKESCGLPLLPHQATSPGQLVTFVIACKPVAEGHIVAHPGFLNAVMDDQNHTLSINVTKSRSMIKITKVLVAGQIHRLHRQTIQWLFAHNDSLAVVTTSQLRTRSENAPLPSELSPGFTSPAPPPTIPSSSDEDDFTVSVRHSSTQSHDEGDDNDADDDIFMDTVEEVFVLKIIFLFRLIRLLACKFECRRYTRGVNQYFS